MRPMPAQTREPLVFVETIVDDAGWGDAGPAAELVRRAVLAAAEHLPVPPSAEIAVLLSNDAHVATLNRDFRGKPTPTNVLSFPAASQDPLEPHLGDIVLARETVEREAADEGKSRDQHLSHLVVHGTLHLFGYDHQTDDEASEMEALETTILAEMGLPDPYAEEA